MIEHAQKRPVKVRAIEWTGDNEAELITFTGAQFNALDAEDRLNSDDPEATAQVHDSLHSTWILVYQHDRIIEGIKGEFYPCRADVWAQTYDVLSVDA